LVVKDTIDIDIVANSFHRAFLLLFSYDIHFLDRTGQALRWSPI
jgi:hypothetical protein